MIGPVVAIAAAALYSWAVLRYRTLFPERGFAGSRAASFVFGMLLFGAALSAPVDALAEHSFAAHMVQHVVLMLIAPPLVLLGAPLLLAVAVPPRHVARRLTAVAGSPACDVLFAPVFAWLLFTGVLWGAHFSPLYESALERPWVHGIEHVLFVAAAFLFWLPVVQVGYAPRPVAFPARILYLVLMFPQGAFLGLAIYASHRVLYAHYVATQGALALADQQNGGAVMWIAGGFIMFVAFMLTVASWARSESDVVAGFDKLGRGSTGRIGDAPLTMTKSSSP